jgi:hypothetical protein
VDKDDILKENPLHLNQHAYQSGKSNKTAFHNVATYRQSATDDKEIALEAFIP